MISGPNQSRDPDAGRIDVLGYEYCRSVLRYFRRHSTETATIDQLERFVREREGEAAISVEIHLHHSTLPRLEDAGLVDYDPRSNEARYRGDPAVERWLNHVVERGEA